MSNLAKFKDALLEFRVRMEPFKFHILALVLAVILGLSVGVVKTMKGPPKLADADRWNLPQWSQFQAAPLRQAMAREGLFAQDPLKKKAAADALVAAAVPIWRFTGTIREGDRHIALIEVDKGRRIKRIMPGDELPGGAKVTAVQVGRLVYTDGTGEQVLSLFNPGEKPSTAKAPKK